MMHTGAPEHFCRPGLISQSSSCAELLQPGRQRVRAEFFIHVARQQKGFAELGGHWGVTPGGPAGVVMAWC